MLNSVFYDTSQSTIVRYSNVTKAGQHVYFPYALLTM